MNNGNVHKGHRQKVRQRYLANGLEGEPAHNVLELLLFYAIPYKDTNPIAHALIDRFGSLSGVLRAGVPELASVKGMGENAAILLHLVLDVYKAYADDLLQTGDTMETAEEIVAYMRPKFINSADEKVYVLCFGANGKLLAVRKVAQGDLVGARIDMRAIAAIVLETNAQDVVLRHNHPNGVASPSGDDIETTKQLYAFLNTMHAHLVNHIIVTENGYYSMADKSRFVHLFYGTDPLVE